MTVFTVRFFRRAQVAFGLPSHPGHGEFCIKVMQVTLRSPTSVAACPGSPAGTPPVCVSPDPLLIPQRCLGACRQKKEVQRKKRSDSPWQDGMQTRTSLCCSSSALACCGFTKIRQNKTGGARPTPTCPLWSCKPISSAWSLLHVPECASPR